MISYTPIIKKPLIKGGTNEVLKWVFAMTGLCDKTGVEVYYDAVWDVSDKPLVRYMMWTKSAIDLEYGKCEVENKFTDVIDRKIKAKCAKILVASDFDYNNAPDTL